MSKKILFIEDDEYLLKAYKTAFEGEFECFLVASGEEGLDKVREVMPNLVVLDLMIPGEISGIDVLEQLKVDEDLKNIPVIVATNLSDQTSKVMSLGAEKCLLKSDFSIDELKNLVHNTAL